MKTSSLKRFTIPSSDRLLPLLLLFLGQCSTGEGRRALGENCDRSRSMHGACEFVDGKELACLNIDGYLQCAPARKRDEICGQDWIYFECEKGLTCPSAGGRCRVAPGVGEFCSTASGTGSANICGMQGFCETETGRCREFITSTVPREDPCFADTNYGYRECSANQRCEYVAISYPEDVYGLCKPRLAVFADGCGYHSFNCEDGSSCRSGRCLSFALEGDLCGRDFDCAGNMRCDTQSSRCNRRSNHIPVPGGSPPTPPPTPSPPPPTPNPTPSIPPPTPLPTPSPTPLPSPPPSPRPTLPPTPRPTPLPTPSPTPPPSPPPTPHPTQSSTPRPTPLPIPSPTIPPSPLPTPNPTPSTPRPTPLPTPSPTPPPSPPPTPRPTQSFTPRPTPSPTPPPAPAPPSPPPISRPTQLSPPSPPPTPLPTPPPTPPPSSPPTPLPTQSSTSPPASLPTPFPSVGSTPSTPRPPIQSSTPPPTSSPLPPPTWSPVLPTPSPTQASTPLTTPPPTTDPSSLQPSTPFPMSLNITLIPADNTIAPVSPPPSISSSSTASGTAQPTVSRPTVDTNDRSPWENYCLSDNKKSTYPCLLKIGSELGWGYDIVSGTKTRKVIELDVHPTANANIFADLTPSVFEIPSNVQCFAIPESKITSSTRSTFNSSIEYKKELAFRLGVSGQFRSVFFSGSSSFRKTSKKTFEKNQVFVESQLSVPLFQCRISTTPAVLTSEADTILFEGGVNMLPKLGIHVITTAKFGGDLLVEMQADSCGVRTQAECALEAKIRAGFLNVATGKGSTSIKIETKCGQAYSVTSFDHVVKGGDQRELDSSGTQESIDRWCQSITASEDQFDAIGFTLEPLTSVVNSVSINQTDDYLSSFQDEGNIEVEHSSCAKCDAEDGCSGERQSERLILFSHIVAGGLLLLLFQ